MGGASLDFDSTAKATVLGESADTDQTPRSSGIVLVLKVTMPLLGGVCAATYRS